MPISQADIRRNTIREWMPGITTALIATTLFTSWLITSLRYFQRPAQSTKHTATTQVVGFIPIKSRSGNGCFLSVRIDGRKVSLYTNGLFTEGQTVRVNYTVTSDGVYKIQRVLAADQLSALKDQ